ncbi:protein NYNRIN-like [Pimephales promelas]|nr:protein NYNRIN-like [Pimephales promelas]
MALVPLFLSCSCSTPYDYIIQEDYHTFLIAKLKSAFARHGIAETVISDNGPCYSSEEFRCFANAWNFTHTTTSPRYPQSNGLAEKTVQTAKRILDKAKAGNTDPYLALLEYRNTPVDNLQSPAQLLMSRRLRSILPATSRHLQPKVAPQKAIQDRRKACQRRQQAYFDRGTRPLSHLSAGTPIRFRQEDGSWRPATVTQHAHTHRSYHIQTEDGQTLRRNRWHLRESRNAPDTKDTPHAETHTNTATTS